MTGVPDIDQANETIEALDFAAEVPCDADTDNVLHPGERPLAATYWLIHCDTVAACDSCRSILVEYQGEAFAVEHLTCGQMFNTGTLRELGPVRS